jgi:hypothetical protein
MLEELNVKLALATNPPVEFAADAETWSTSPAFRETEFGLNVTEVTLLGSVEMPPPVPEPPPQPAKTMAKNNNEPPMMTERIQPPRKGPPLCGNN